MENKKVILKLNNMIKSQVKKRPSSKCKTPYVADIITLNTNEEVICHAPSLGCCGYVDKDEFVYIVENEVKKTCSHNVQLALRQEKGEEYLIGVHPKQAENIVSLCLQKGYIKSLENISCLQREKKYLNSRFDFVCKDENNTLTIIEVKNVPCGDYEDIYFKDRLKKDYSTREINTKVAYFPDGYRKKKKDTVSPRALKHITELEQLKKEQSNIRTIIIFVVQRPDCVLFQGSNVDPIYKNALNNAYDNGVEVIPIQVVWELDGSCVYKNILPFSK